MWTIANADPSICQSVIQLHIVHSGMRFHPTNTDDQTEVLFEVESLEDPRNIRWEP